MTDSQTIFAQRGLSYILILAIVLLLISIHNNYSPDLLNEFQYELAKSFGGLDNTLAGR
jgi:hypothetical protein